MQAREVSKRPTPALPFVGRAKEASQLRRLHARHRHVLILGSAGVGKSALVAHLRGQLPFLWCPRSEYLGEICDSLEGQLGFNAGGLKLVPRKQRLRRALAESGQTVVFDGLGWTTPKLGSFLESVMERVPVWLCTRSEHSWEIGHFWTSLVLFERVELHPFHPAETRALVEAAIEGGRIPSETRGIVGWLHRVSAGSPLVLRRLFEVLATGRYDLADPLALRRLDLDRRIQEIFPIFGNAPLAGKGKR